MTDPKPTVEALRPRAWLRFKVGADNFCGLNFDHDPTQAEIAHLVANLSVMLESAQPTPSETLKRHALARIDEQVRSIAVGMRRASVRLVAKDLIESLESDQRQSLVAEMLLEYAPKLINECRRGNRDAIEALASTGDPPPEPEPQP